MSALPRTPEDRAALVVEFDILCMDLSHVYGRPVFEANTYAHEGSVEDDEGVRRECPALAYGPTADEAIDRVLDMLPCARRPTLQDPAGAVSASSLALP